MRALIYTRASLDRTGEGKSNSRQREECLRLVDFKRWDLVKVDDQESVDDVSISAYGLKERPGWNRVLAMIENGEVDVVVAWHLDRLTRNMADLEKLILLCEGHGVSVATATGDIDLTNDTGRMVARILAAVARQEVERKAARQRLAHMQRRAEGRPWAAVKMLGYTPKGEVIQDEAAAIRAAIQAVLDNDTSLAAIARQWTELELRSPYQAIRDEDGNQVGWKDWSPRGVRGVLTNPRLAGFVTHDGEVLGKGEWEPILSETELTLVTAKLSAPERVAGGNEKRGRLPSNLLTGIMVCAKCGGTVRAGVQRGVDTYTCGKWHTSVERADADELVRNAFAAAVALTSPGQILPNSHPEGVDLDSVSEEIRRLRERQDVLARSFARGITSEAAYEAAAEEIAGQISELEAKAQGSLDEIEWTQVRKASVLNFLRQDMAEQRRVLSRTSSIRLHPSGRKGKGARWQIEVQVRAQRAGQELLIPAHIPGVLQDA